MALIKERGLFSQRHSFPAPSAKWRRRYKSCESSPGDPATKVQKQSNPPIPGLKEVNKVDKSHAMPAYAPRSPPPPPHGMTADKCIMSHSNT